MNGLIILVALVNLIASRDITTISFSERSNLSKIGMAEVFKNEGAFVRYNEVKLFFYQTRFRLLLTCRLNSLLQFCSSKKIPKTVWRKKHTQNFCCRMDPWGELSQLMDNISKSMKKILNQISKDGCNLTTIRSDLPPCVSRQFLTVQKYFDELDSLIVALVKDLAGTGNTTWTSPEDQKDHSISEKYFKVNKDLCPCIFFYFLWPRTIFMCIRRSRNQVSLWAPLPRLLTRIMVWFSTSRHLHSILSSWRIDTGSRSTRAA